MEQQREAEEKRGSAERGSLRYPPERRGRGPAGRDGLVSVSLQVTFIELNLARTG